MSIGEQEARLLRFLKEWTLPVAMLTGTLIYLVFAFTPQLDEAGEFCEPIIDAIFPMFMFLILFVTFCKVDFHKLRPVGWHLWVGVFQVTFVVMVVSAVLIFHIKGDNLIATVMQATGRPLNVNTGSFTNHGLELSGDYRFTDRWSVNANYSYLHMKKPIMGAPEGKLYLGANYQHGPFSLAMGLQHISDLYLTSGSAGLTESFTLLNATASYRIVPQVRLFVKGDNLLAERYQTYNGYPMPKATFMGGVSVDL
jgi:outer membrane cobalamin receptor